jgi:hypothetical protein
VQVPDLLITLPLNVFFHKQDFLKRPRADESFWD